MRQNYAAPASQNRQLRHNRVKVLYFVGDGLVIFYRRLETGTFEMPRAVDAGDGKAASVELRWSDLALILEGIELSSVRRRIGYGSRGGRTVSPLVSTTSSATMGVTWGRFLVMSELRSPSADVESVAS